LVDRLDVARHAFETKAGCGPNGCRGERAERGDIDCSPFTIRASRRANSGMEPIFDALNLVYGGGWRVGIADLPK
jgi:hypothetical protein